jgi:hypothetical protein
VFYDVLAYLNLQYRPQSNEWPKHLEDVVEGVPMWATLFYALRCGDVKIAAQLANKVSAVQCSQECGVYACACMLISRQELIEEAGSSFPRLVYYE